jgi:hypothetical protein
VLYGVVREHLETFLAHTRETYEAPLPRYVEEELRGYLRCGIFAHGFLRAHCDGCGHDLLVAFSCLGRGVCPSCAGRRMANVAAHLVDRVLPAVPVRQWVLSLPFELRALAAFRADVLAALVRIFIEAIDRRHRAWAKRVGLGDAPTGAVTHVQRFGSSVNLNVHFHVMVLDGVFTRDKRGRSVFHPAPPPTHDELDEVVRRVRRRAESWLARKGPAADSPDSDAASAPTPLDACAAIAMQRGSVRVVGKDPDASHDDGGDVNAPPPGEGAVERDGFNLHASVAIAADDDLGRERLMRYGARPPLALDRLRRLPGGRLAYRVKVLRDGRAKSRVMTPLEFLARLAALVPPPRYPLLRYHGVLAPRSAWRRDVVPRAPETRAVPESPGTIKDGRPPRPEQRSAARGAPGPGCHGHSERAARRDQGEPSPSPLPVRTIAIDEAPSVTAIATLPARAGANVALLAPNVLSVRHWHRLLGGLLYAASPRVDWPTLLRRSFDVDVLECPSCRGRLRVLGEVIERTMVRLMLDRMGVPTNAPRAARARDPTGLLGEVTDD